MASTAEQEEEIKGFSGLELVAAAGHSVQSLEQLNYLMSRSTPEDSPSQQVLEECREMLDRARQMKSALEGSDYSPFSPAPLDSSAMSQLKHLVLAHTPGDMPEEHKAKMADQLSEVLAGRVKTLLYACLLTCPWYSGAQKELSSRANRNVLFVVYVALDKQFFSLTTPHNKTLLESTDHGYLYMCEVRHYCSEVLRGHVRSLEAFYSPPESVVVCSPPWLKLVSLLHTCGGSLLDRRFLASCLGQATGALAARSKYSTGKMVLKSGVELATFCNSSRLLSYVSGTLEDGNIVVWTSGSNFPNTQDKDAVAAMDLLQQGFAGREVSLELLDCILTWKERLSQKPQPKSESRVTWSIELGRWLAEQRLQGLELTPPPEISDTDSNKLSELLHTLSLGSLHPRDVLMVCLAGSRLYNLAVPTSDKDYIVVFRQPTQDLLSCVDQLSESKHNRGEQLAEEAGAYEARMICDMLLKGAVNIVEILFAAEWFYVSPEWEELAAARRMFLSEKVILQYVGYVKTHMSRIKSGKYANTAREKKIFYSIFHKLLSLEAFVSGRPPVVQCSGEDRDFILRIRTGPLEGDLSSENLYLLAETRLSQVRQDLRARSTRLKEYGDYNFLHHWLTRTVRRVTGNSDLV